jgi:hypothetical protein
VIEHSFPLSYHSLRLSFIVSSAAQERTVWILQSTCLNGLYEQASNMPPARGSEGPYTGDLGVMSNSKKNERGPQGYGRVTTVVTSSVLSRSIRHFNPRFSIIVTPGRPLAINY